MTSMFFNSVSETAVPATPAGIAVILLGPPGCGKGTQARELFKSFGFVHLSTGDLLRIAACGNTELGQMVQSRMRAGELVPDEVISQIIAESITPQALESGLVLDGYPRTLQQALFLSSILRGCKAIALNMHLAREILVQRITGRLTCSACGEIYNALFKKPKHEGICDRDGEQLQQRVDDTETTIRQRLESYETETRPVIEHFRRLEILHDIQAEMDTAIIARQFHEKVRFHQEGVSESE